MCSCQAWGHIFHFPRLSSTLSWITCVAVLGLGLPAASPPGSKQLIWLMFYHDSSFASMRHIRDETNLPNTPGGEFQDFFFPLSIKSCCIQLYCCIRANFSKMLLILDVPVPSLLLFLFFGLFNYFKCESKNSEAESEQNRHKIPVFFMSAYLTKFSQ